MQIVEDLPKLRLPSTTANRDHPLEPEDMCFENQVINVEAMAEPEMMHTERKLIIEEEIKEPLPDMDMPELHQYTSSEGNLEMETYLILMVHGIGSDAQWQLINA